MHCDRILVPACTKLPLLGLSAHLRRAQATANKRSPLPPEEATIGVLKLNLRCLSLSAIYIPSLGQ